MQHQFVMLFSSTPLFLTCQLWSFRLVWCLLPDLTPLRCMYFSRSCLSPSPRSFCPASTTISILGPLGIKWIHSAWGGGGCSPEFKTSAGRKETKCSMMIPRGFGIWLSFSVMRSDASQRIECCEYRSPKPQPNAFLIWFCWICLTTAEVPVFLISGMKFPTKDINSRFDWLEGSRKCQYSMYRRKFGGSGSSGLSRVEGVTSGPGARCLFNTPLRMPMILQLAQTCKGLTSTISMTLASSGIMMILYEIIGNEFVFSVWMLGMSLSPCFFPLLSWFHSHR